MKANKIFIYGFVVFLFVIGVYIGTKNISVSHSDSGPEVLAGDIDTEENEISAEHEEVVVPDPNCKLDEEFYVLKEDNANSQVDKIKDSIGSERCYAQEIGNGIYSTVFKFGDKEPGVYVYGYLYSENIDLVDNVVLKTSNGKEILPSKDSEISNNEAILIFELDDIDENYEILVSDKNGIYNVRRKMKECGGTKCVIE